MTIRQSKLSATGPGQDEALANDGGSAKITVSQLVGRIQVGGNNTQCFDNYDEDLNKVNCRSAAGGGSLSLTRACGAVSRTE